MNPSSGSRPPPSLLLSERRGRLFHAPDARFSTPRAVFVAAIEMSVPPDDSSSSSPLVLDHVMREVGSRYIAEVINEEAYAATLCGYSYELSASEHGLNLEVVGFSHKLPMLVKTICDALKQLADAPADRPTLELVLSEYELDRKNACFAVGELAIDERLRCLEALHLTAEDKLKVLPSVDAGALSRHLADAMSGGVRLVAYAGGNLRSDEARSLFEGVHAALGAPPSLPDDWPPLRRCAVLPCGRKERRRRELRRRFVLAARGRRGQARAA